MSGHSHWAGIKHKKAAQDKKRGKVFSKIAKLITIAARESGGDPDANLKLKYAVEKARSVNMPKDNIDRAIKKGTGELEGEALSEVIYEGYASGGVAVLVETLTDNKNRTISEVRKIFEKRGGNLGGAGCVAWMFNRRGLIRIPAENYEEMTLLEMALEAGAENVESEDGFFNVTTPPSDLMQIRGFFEDKKIRVESAELTYVPTSTVPVDATTGRKVLALLDELENHEDVEAVHSNFDMPEDVFKQLETEEAD